MQIAPIENPKVSEKWGTTLDYDAVLFGLSQTDTEPSSYQNFLLSSAATHQWQPKQKTPATEWEARIDKLFVEQSGERDAAKRLQQFAEIQQILREEMPIIPIAARHVVSAANSRIGNYSPSSILPYSLWNAEELFIKQ
jgi:peptide/nickel transport system substrate-binding protein